MFNIFDDLDAMDSMFDFLAPMTVGYSCPAFPPTNVELKEDGAMKFDFALAGYKKEDLNIDYSNNKLILATTDDFNKSLSKEKTEDNSKVLNHGIKKISFNYSYLIPENKFDVDKLTAKFEDGILTILIPARDKKLVVNKKFEIN